MCEVWANDIIERHKSEGRSKLTKTALSRLVDDKYRAFIASYPKETPEFQKLHPPGSIILPVGAELAPNGSIYNRVTPAAPAQDMTYVGQVQL